MLTEPRAARLEGQGLGLRVEAHHGGALEHGWRRARDAGASQRIGVGRRQHVAWAMRLRLLQSNLRRA